jgi:hypothetical protein
LYAGGVTPFTPAQPGFVFVVHVRFREQNLIQGEDRTLSDRKPSQRSEPRAPTRAEFARLSFSKKLTLITIRRAQIGSRLAVAAIRLGGTERS